MNEEIKALLEELQLPEETGTKIVDMLSEAFEKAKEDGKEEGKKEAEEKAAADSEAKDKEHAEEVENLKEMANQYGEFLMEKANSYGEHVQGILTEKMKEYADFAVEQFITENKERFVATEEYQRMASAFGMIKEAYEQHGFDVRTDAVAQDLQKSLEESTEEYEKVFEELQAARAEASALRRTIILENATRDLADTQKEKVNELLESVSFESDNEFEEGLKVFVEQAAQAGNAKAAVEEVLTEDAPIVGKKAIDPNVARYLSRPGLL